MKLKLFRKGKNELAVRNESLVVSVPDIKEYLVREYARVEELRLKNEKLEFDLEIARELKFKYDAALVTLDEYSKRLQRADSTISNEKQKVENIRDELKSARDVINSYKIQLHEAALTKDEIKKEIVEETKANLISKIKTHKGNLSKNKIYDLIMEVTI